MSQMLVKCFYRLLEYEVCVYSCEITCHSLNFNAIFSYFFLKNLRYLLPVFLL